MNESEAEEDDRRVGRDAVPPILVIEQFEAVRSLMEVALRHKGFETVAVARPEEVLGALGAQPFACAIVGSPAALELDGRTTTFLEYLAQDPRILKSPLVVLTTLLDGDHVLSLAAELDAWAVFVKPFSALEFMDVVAECVAGRRPQRRAYGLPDDAVSVLESRAGA